MNIKFAYNRLIIVLLSFILFLSTANCSAFAEEHILTILHTNDVHGRLEPIKYKNSNALQGGIARRATLIHTIKSQNKNVLTLDAGDISQGTLFFKFFNGIPDMKIMSDIGYDVAAPGNHEFDKGLDIFAQMTKAAKFPFICANLDLKDNMHDIKLNKYIVKDYGEFKVGIIGVIAENLKAITMIKDDVSVKNPTKEVRELVKKLKSKVDLVIVLSHQGIDEDIKLAKAIPEIDIIVGGHSHTLLKKPIIIDHKSNRTMIVQAGELGVNLGELDIKFNSKNIKSYDYKLIPINEDLKEDKTISELVSELSSRVQLQTNVIIGHTLLPITSKSSNLLNQTGILVNKALKESCPDAEIIFQNSGAMRLKRVIPTGAITKADVFEIFPFENKLTSGELKGSEIKSILESSVASLPNMTDFFLQTESIAYTVDISKESQKTNQNGTKIIKKGMRVKDIYVNGNPLIANKYYKVVANDFLFKGGDGFVQFKKAKNVEYSDLYIQDLIINYIKKNSPLNLEIHDKIKVIKGNNNLEENKVLPNTVMIYDNMFAKLKLNIMRECNVT